MRLLRAVNGQCACERRRGMPEWKWPPDSGLAARSRAACFFFDRIFKGENSTGITLEALAYSYTHRSTCG